MLKDKTNVSDALGMSLKKADGSVENFMQIDSPPRAVQMLTDDAPVYLKGAIHIQVRGPDGQLKDELHNPNLVVTAGKTAIATLLKSVVAGSNLSVAGTSSSSGLILVQTTAAHGLTTGQDVFIYNTGGTVEANGFWSGITTTDSTHFTLPGSTYTNSWTSGGSVVPGPSEFQWMGLGTGTTSPAAGDTYLGTEISTGLSSLRVTATRTNPSATSILYSSTWNPGQATNTAITEAGIFAGNVIPGSPGLSGTMLARSTFSAIAKGTGDTLSLSWTISLS
jgi:hypothetical protein